MVLGPHSGRVQRSYNSHLYIYIPVRVACCIGAKYSATIKTLHVQMKLDKSLACTDNRLTISSVLVTTVAVPHVGACVSGLRACAGRA